MPNMEEKKAFEHGCRCMLKMLEGSGYILQEGGRYDLCAVIFKLVDKAEKDAERMADMYAVCGYDVVMQACTYRRK